jgi:hypothetical protein
VLSFCGEKMMLDLCSGKVGYTLYKGGKGNVTETEVNYWFRHGTCDKIVDSAREKMYKMMAEGICTSHSPVVEYSRVLGASASSVYLHISYQSR